MSDGTELEHVAEVPDSLWQRIRAEPERTPEHLALAAAERFGPAAALWAEHEARSRPPGELAKLAVKKHVRMARVEGAALGLGGAVTAAADLLALAWVQSRMVFFIAAAHGYDPRHPMRPAELLALQGIYETPAEAREALDGIGKSLAFALAESKLRGHDEEITKRLVKFVGKRMAQRVGGRLIPLIGAPIGAVQNSGATKELAQRAVAYYGGAGPAA